MQNRLTAVVALALVAVLVPAVVAQQDSSTQPRVKVSQAAASQAQSLEAFSGTIVKVGNKYVLKTETATYQFEDQERAKQFEGKQVKVSGSVEKAMRTLHIAEIQSVN
jgi:hypothetical protein